MTLGIALAGLAAIGVAVWLKLDPRVALTAGFATLAVMTLALILGQTGIAEVAAMFAFFEFLAAAAFALADVIRNPTPMAPAVESSMERDALSQRDED